MQASDFVTPAQIFRFALYELKVGLTKAEIESKIGVGIVTTAGSSYVYDIDDNAILELVYGKGTP